MEESEGVRLGHWSFEDSPIKRGKRKEIKDEQEDERLLDKVNQALLDAIPDIGTLQEEELIAQIAVPPSAAASKTSTFMELDKDLQRHSRLFTLEDGVDLSLLASILSPVKDVQEEDNCWTFDALLTEISFDIELIWLNTTREEKNTTL